MSEGPLILNRKSILTRDIADYPEGIIIPVDKPYRWTSADVIRKIKFTAIRRFGKKNLKVGHAGTLDPLATGVLLVCIGQATKLAETLQSHDKEYIAGITFGATTPSYDREKDIDRYFPHSHITKEAVEAVLPSFLGEQDQIAPLFSAKSVDGVRAYEIARKLLKQNGFAALDEATAGLLRSARIRIDALEILDFGVTAGNPSVHDNTFVSSGEAADGGVAADGGEVADGGASAGDHEPVTNGGVSKASSRINISTSQTEGLPRISLRIACSKGTYIRALARDLGEAIDSGAFLDSLIRSRSGNFTTEESLSIEDTLKILSI